MLTKAGNTGRSLSALLVLPLTVLALTLSFSFFAFFTAPARAQSPETEIQNLQREVDAARDRVAERQTDVDALIAEHERASHAVNEAERAAARAETDLDFERRRLGSSQSATEYLSGPLSIVNSLRQELNNTPDTPANQTYRDALEKQIREATDRVSEEAQEYGRRSNAALSAFDQARKKAEEAEKAAAAAHQRLNALDAQLAGAQDNLRAAEDALDRVLSRMAEATEKHAPGYLREVKVSQEGEVIYHARWRKDTSEKDLVKDMIAELEKQIAELQRLRGQVTADIKRYNRDIGLAGNEKRRLEEELEWNNDVIKWSGRLQYFGEALLLVASGAGVVSGVYKAVAAAERGTVTLGFLARETTKHTAMQMGIGGLPNAYSWPNYAQRLRAALGARTTVVAAEAMLEGKSYWTIGSAALTAATQMGMSANNLRQTPGERYTGPDIGRFAEDYEQTLRLIGAFNDDRRDYLARLETRKAYETNANEFLTKSYNEAQKKVREKDKSFWRRWKVGKIFTSDAEIAAAYDLVHIKYWTAVRKAAQQLRGLARGERRLIDEQLRKQRRELESVREKLPGAAERGLQVLVNKRLKIGEEDSATIELSFTRAMREEPRVIIGRGALARPAGGNPGEGLPLPGPEEGAVMVEMTGQNESWSGTFRTKPLAAFLESSDPIPVLVHALDMAGRKLDADPRTPATRRGGGWIKHEAVRGGSLSGGGTDDWHKLNAIYEDGTSYVFVVDASGSMEDNNRMTRVKRSAHTFIENMERGDEVALVVFYDCGNIQTVVPFTRDKQGFLSVLDSNRVAPTGDTPLAAAIGQAGDYLLGNANYEKRAMVVLTDGEETCDGDPVAAAALFRRQVAVLGDIGESRPWDEDDTEEETAPEQPPEEEEEVVEAEPANREAWRFANLGGSRDLPTLALVRTHFREWGPDGECAAIVKEETYYAYYGRLDSPDAPPRIRWGVNPQPSKSDTLDFAMCLKGQAGMDAIRSKWADLPGGPRQQAEAELGERVGNLLQ